MILFLQQNLKTGDECMIIHIFISEIKVLSLSSSMDYAILVLSFFFLMSKNLGIYYEKMKVEVNQCKTRKISQTPIKSRIIAHLCLGMESKDVNKLNLKSIRRCAETKHTLSTRMQEGRAKLWKMHFCRDSSPECQDKEHMICTP